MQGRVYFPTRKAGKGDMNDQICFFLSAILLGLGEIGTCVLLLFGVRDWFHVGCIVMCLWEIGALSLALINIDNEEPPACCWVTFVGGSLIVHLLLLALVTGLALLCAFRAPLEEISCIYATVAFGVMTLFAATATYSFFKVFNSRKTHWPTYLPVFSSTSLSHSSSFPIPLSLP